MIGLTNSGELKRITKRLVYFSDDGVMFSLVEKERNCFAVDRDTTGFTPIHENPLVLRLREHLPKMRVVSRACGDRVVLTDEDRAILELML